VSRYGGLCEEFRGWGGEDNAWYYKARLLGRAGVTERSDQHLYHLYHPRSGGYGREQPGDRNPRYARNVELLNEMRRLTSANRFLARFPSPAPPSPPWCARPRFEICNSSADEHLDKLVQTLSAALADTYGREAPSGDRATVDIRLSCENPADPDGYMNVIMRRPSKTGDEAREEIRLDGERIRADPNSLLKTFIAPLSVLLADAQLDGFTGDKANGSRQSLGSTCGSLMKLNLGCCDALLAGYVNVDIIAGIGVEVADLSKPWPWRDSSIDFIRAHDIIEHLPDKILTMNETWRVLKPGCEAEIVVPTTDGPGAFQDPTHVSFWHRRSFMYYESGNPYRERFARPYGITARFRIVRDRVDMTQDGPKLTIVLAAVK
jgi:SAM-dependent methyltransferase